MASVWFALPRCFGDLASFDFSGLCACFVSPFAGRLRSSNYREKPPSLLLLDPLPPLLLLPLALRPTTSTCTTARRRDDNDHGNDTDDTLLPLATWITIATVTTVDGRNPAPPGMYKTLQIMG